MKPGDILTCNNNMRWVLIEEYDTSVSLVNFETQTFNAVIDKKLITNIEDSKVEWLFLARRRRTLKGMERYL